MHGNPVEGKRPLTRPCVATLWGTKGTMALGHEFHYSEIAGPVGNKADFQDVYSAQRRSGSDSLTPGFQKQNILASYAHLHLASKPDTIKHFVKTMEAHRA